MPKAAEAAMAKVKEDAKNQQEMRKVGLGNWWASLTKKELPEYREYKPIQKPELSQTAQQQLQNALDSFHQKNPALSLKITSAVRNVSATLDKIDNFLTNPSQGLSQVPVIGKPVSWAGRTSKEYGFKAGDLAAEQTISGVEQMKSGRTSKVPFTNIQLPSYVAGPLKIGLAAFNVTPLGMKTQFVMDKVEDAATKKFGNESIIPPVIGLGAGLLVPGGETNDIRNAKLVASRLEGSLNSENKLSKTQQLFRQLPLKDRMTYLAGKFSKEDLKLSAPDLWSKIEKVEVEAEKTSKAFNGLFTKWVRGREMAKTRGVQEALTINPNIKGDEFLNRAEGTIAKASPEVEKAVATVRNKLDILHKEANSAGIPTGYLENYLPHLWQQSPEEVQQITKGLGKFKHSGERKILSYADGIEAGLTPLYTSANQIIGVYSKNLSEAKANLQFIKDLKLSKLISSEKLPGTVAITAEKFPRSIVKTASKTKEGNFYAIPEIANLLNRVFETPNLSGAEKLLEKVANVSGAVQDVALAGGIPGTPVNAWTLSQYLFKEIPAGRFTAGPKAMWNSMVNPAEHFKSKQGTILAMQREGIPVSTSLNLDSINKSLSRGTSDIEGLIAKGKQVAGNIVENYKNFNIEFPGLWDKTKKIWSATMNEATFKRFMPNLQISFFEDSMRAALKQGMDAEHAQAFAGRATKAFHGIVSSEDLIKKSQLGQDVLATLFFAPRYRETIVRFLVNNIESVSTKITDPAYSKNRTWIVGKIIQYFVYNEMNKKTTGHPMADNPPGYTDGILVKVGDGRTIKLPLDSSILTIPRTLIAAGENLAEGDVPGAMQTIGSRATSTLIQPISDLARNKDYFDREIVDSTATTGEKYKQAAAYVAQKYNNPLLRELTDSRSQGDPVWQRMLRAFEIPIRVYKNASIENANYFNNLKEARKGLSKQELAIVQAEDARKASVKKEQEAKYAGKTLIDEEGIPTRQKTALENMQIASQRLNNPGIIEAETQAAIKTAQETGEPIAPYYLLTPEQQKVLELLKTIYPGESLKSDIRDANPWLQEYYLARSEYYEQMKASGKFVSVLEDSGAPVVSADLQEKLNTYFALPTGTGERTKYAAQYPEILKYFEDNRIWNNAQRAELGIPLLPDYGYGGYSNKKSLPKIKASTPVKILTPLTLQKRKKLGTFKVKPLKMTTLKTPTLKL